MFNQLPRPIKSDLKSKRITWEEEKPIRWSYMKLLREYSTLKEFYPDINPYVEVYRLRDNLFCLYSESLDGMGDPWMYLIEGPKKALLVDTGFGVGNLKALVEYLVPNKELIVVNTHAHFDHAYGNAQFDVVHCHKAEVYNLQKKNNPHIWDYLFDSESGKPLFTEFDRNDLIEYKPYQIVGVEDGYLFDLGDDYLVEAIHLPGHAPGQCGFYDLVNKTLFTGDTGGIGSPSENDPHSDLYTVEALRDSLVKLEPRFPEIVGVFPGHGMLDQTNSTMQYLLDCAEAILKNPDSYDSVKEIERWGNKRTIYFKNIHQGSSIRYTKNNVYKSR